MILLDQSSCKFMTVSIPLIAGLGMGLLFRSPFAAMEKALPEKDRAPMTACFFLVRFIGTSVGLVSCCFSGLTYLAGHIVFSFPTFAKHASLAFLLVRRRPEQSLTLASNKLCQPDLPLTPPVPWIGVPWSRSPIPS